MTGCTILVTLFVMGTNMIISVGERERAEIPKTSNIKQRPNREFMDDLTIATDIHIQARWILKALEETAWCRKRSEAKRKKTDKLYKAVEMGVQDAWSR